MGIYISAINCKELYDIDINCEILVNGNDTYPNTPIIGGLLQGQIPPDPDIAGIGVVASFIGTTAFAIALSGLTLLKLMANRRYLHQLNKLTENLALAHQLNKFHVSELCEELVIGVSDTQVFTGAAYAMALRYFKGCTTIAYHYNIVVMMMLLTCATHMLSVTIVRNYWRWGWLSFVRLVTCSGVFIVTGILLANQNNGFPDERQFPSQIPPPDANYSAILLPAACFQVGNSQLLNTLHSSVGDKAADAFLKSQPGNSIPGWNCYLTTLLLYILAGLVDILKAFRRGAQSRPNGKRARLVRWLHLSTLAQRQTRQQRSNKIWKKKPPKQQEGQVKKPKGIWASRFSPGNIIFYLFCSYLASGISVAIWTIWVASHEIGQLRSWIKAKGWLIHTDNVGNGHMSAEDDSTSFGQLVPIFLNLMLLFVLLHVINNFCSRGKRERKYDIYGGIIQDYPHPPHEGKTGSDGHGTDTMGGAIAQPTEVVDHLNVGYKPDTGTPVQQVHGYHEPVSMSNLAPAQSGSPHPTSNGQWNNFTPAPGSQPGTPGPGIMTTTPTTAQIHQFPTSPSPKQTNSRRQSTASPVPTSPLAGAGGNYFPFQQQQQQQPRSMSMNSSHTHVGSPSPQPQPQQYAQGQGQPYFQQQQPQYTTYDNNTSNSPPPQAQNYTQHQQQPQGPVYYQVMQ